MPYTRIILRGDKTMLEIAHNKNKIREINGYLHKVAELLKWQNIGVQDWTGFVNIRLQ
jgi:hypothetical protein